MQKPSELLTQVWDKLDDFNAEGLDPAIRMRIETASAELAVAVADLERAEL